MKDHRAIFESFILQVCQGEYERTQVSDTLKTRLAYLACVKEALLLAVGPEGKCKMEATAYRDCYVSGGSCEEARVAFETCAIRCKATPAVSE